MALPGLVDLHTHLREPGREDAETVETGTRAAALGGFTAVHAMANTDPVADTAGVVEQVWRLGQRPGTATCSRSGRSRSASAASSSPSSGAMADSAAAVRVFSDDGHCVSDAVLMRRALEYVKAFDGVIAQHAQEPRLTEGAQMNEGVLSGVLGLQGWPAVAEEAIIARDVLLAEHVGSRLHVCHVSTAGTVEILRQAKARGVDVTAEVTPHHLLLTDDLVTTYDPVYKVNPPLRTKVDVEALREALADGTIDAVATDHAPHAVEDKDCEWAAAAFGMLGLEQALAVVTETMVETGLLDWAGVADRMSFRPARIGRLGGHGRPLGRRGAREPRAGRPGRPGHRRAHAPGEQEPQHALRRPDPARPGGRDLPARTADRARRVVGVTAAPLDVDSHVLVDTPGPAAGAGWPERIALSVGIALFVGVALWGMWRAWRRLGERQDDLGLLPVRPPTWACCPSRPPTWAMPWPGRSRAATWPPPPTGGQLVVQGLALAGVALLAVTDAGVYIERTGAPGVFLPSAALRGARLESGAPGSVHGTGRLRRRSPGPTRGRPCDTGFRADLPRRHAEVVDAVAGLARPPDRQPERAREPGGHPMTSPAILVLEDGRTFRGTSYGAVGETFGEAVFCTAMTGYQETLTDPSYHRQVVVMTAPHIGNTGVNDEDPESASHLGERLRRPRPGPATVELARAAHPRGRARARRASWASAASTPARSPGTCATAAPCGSASPASRPTPGRCSAGAREPVHGRRRPRR